MLTIQDPWILFSTPGMLHAGTSQHFKQESGDPKIWLLIPGFCVAGTVSQGAADVNKLKSTSFTNCRRKSSSGESGPPTLTRKVNLQPFETVEQRMCFLFMGKRLKWYASLSESKVLIASRRSQRSDWKEYPPPFFLQTALLSGFQNEKVVPACISNLVLDSCSKALQAKHLPKMLNW
jgi:hypothetical protein